MSLVQVTLDVPDEVKKNILSGALTITAGIARDNKGIIRKHLPTVAYAAKSNATELLKNKGMIISLGIAVATALGTGVVAIVKKSKKKNDESEVQECVERFKEAMHCYLKATQEGNLNEDTLNSLITALENLQNNNENGTIMIDLSADQLNALFMQIFNYTKRLAEANSVKVKGLKAPKRTSENNIINLQHYLEIQKKIIESAS
jgi:hypothetical protein